MEAVESATIGYRDLLSEGMAGLLARPGRAVLTILGTVLGVGALVATVGFARTAGNQIVGRFDELAATSVVVTSGQALPSSIQQEALIPADAQSRLLRLNGVTAAGVFGPVDIGAATVRSVPVIDPLAHNEFDVTVFAASDGLLDAVRGRLTTGRFFDSGHSQRGDNVAVLGPGAARRLGITRVRQQPVVFVGDEPFVVIGILNDVKRQPELLNGIIIPEGTARNIYTYKSPTTVQIDVDVGAATLIASQAPIALHPNAPDLLQVQKPPELDDLRSRVEGDVDSLFLVLGGVALLVGAIGIANVTLVSVLERVGEIGLRRALGAARHHIAMQFLVESGAMGLVGGIVGASLGVLLVVTLSAQRGWTPVIDLWIPLAAPILGALLGLLAGAYPAFRASRLEPVEALRAG